MNETVNPYQSPEAEVIPEKPLLAHGSITETMIVHLKKASPWLRFIGVVGFILSGILVLIGIMIIPLSTHAFFRTTGIDSFDFTATGGCVTFGMVIYFLGMAAIFFFLSLFAYRFGDKIRTYIRTGAEQDLEIAFKNNSMYWKMYGILHIIGILIIPLIFVGSIIAVMATLLN